MSTLVINSASRVARGIIKELLRTSAAEHVVCADLYPNYKAWERYISLGSEIPDYKANIQDRKYEGKLELSSAIASAKEIIYVTHDYYLNVPEYDHCEEKEPNYAGILEQSKHQNAINLRLDLTFDEDSQIVQNTILRRISSGSSLYFKQEVAKAARRPIKVSDVGQAVVEGLKNGELRGSFFLQGDRSVSYPELIATLEKTARRGTVYNASREENWVAPTGFNMLSTKLYTTCYLNSQGIIHSTRTGEDGSQGRVTDLLGTRRLADLQDFYSEGKFVGMKAHGHTPIKKFLLY